MVRQKIFGGAEQQASKLFFTRLMELIFVGSKLLLKIKKKKKTWVALQKFSWDLIRLAGWKQLKVSQVITGKTVDNFESASFRTWKCNYWINWKAISWDIIFCQVLKL